MNDSSTDPLSFSLIDQPWLLVRDRDGGVTKLSVLDTLRWSHQLAGLAGDVPTQVFALTRMLLAILHGALRPRSVADWEALWVSEQLPTPDIESYLDTYRDRFDLLHPTTPFMQVVGLSTEKGEMADLSKLIADVPNGHRFFTNRMGADLSLSYAEAARWLVHCHAFDPSGIKSGAVGDPRVKKGSGKGYPIGVAWSGLLGGILPEGRTLRETLLLNLIPNDHGDVDTPVWEREALGPAEQDLEALTPAGPVTLFTWQSRRVRLHVEHGAVTGVLICNGDALTPQNMHTTETHTAWRRSEPQQKKLRQPVVYMPLEHRVERVIWRGLEAMLPDRARSQGKEATSHLSASVTEWLSQLSNERLLAKNYPLRMRTIGMVYGGQSSTIDDIIDDALSLQAILVDQDAEELRGAALASVEAAENAARALGFLAAHLTRAAGGDPEGPRTRAVESAYAELDPRFRVWLSTLGPGADPDERQTEWHRQADAAIRVLGEEMVAASSPTAWVGRRHNDRLYTTSHAVARFRRDLREALPYAHGEAA